MKMMTIVAAGVLACMSVVCAAEPLDLTHFGFSPEKIQETAAATPQVTGAPAAQAVAVDPVEQKELQQIQKFRTVLITLAGKGTDSVAEAQAWVEFACSAFKEVSNVAIKSDSNKVKQAALDFLEPYTEDRGSAGNVYGRKLLDRMYYLARTCFDAIKTTM